MKFTFKSAIKKVKKTIGITNSNNHQKCKSDKCKSLSKDKKSIEENTNIVTEVKSPLEIAKEKAFKKKQEYLERKSILDSFGIYIPEKITQERLDFEELEYGHIIEEKEYDRDELLKICFSCASYYSLGDILRLFHLENQVVKFGLEKEYTNVISEICESNCFERDLSATVYIYDNCKTYNRIVKNLILTCVDEQIERNFENGARERSFRDTYYEDYGNMLYDLENGEALSLMVFWSAIGRGDLDNAVKAYESKWFQTLGGCEYEVELALKSLLENNTDKIPELYIKWGNLKDKYFCFYNMEYDFEVDARLDLWEYAQWMEDVDLEIAKKYYQKMIDVFDEEDAKKRLSELNTLM